MVLAWENFQRDFCDVGCCSSFIVVFVTLVVVLHSLLFDVIPHPSVTIDGFLHPLFTFNPAHRRVIRDTFILTFPGPAFIFLPQVSFEWEFFTKGVFLLYAPSPHFCHNLLLSRSPWLPAVLPWSLHSFMVILKTQTRSSVLLIHSNPQSWYSEEFLFKSYYTIITLPWFTSGKKFGYLLLTRFELFSLVQSHM